jgi:hypothetical protein
MEWGRYKGMRAEIQVRTALQHAWAAVSHKLDYKSADEVPPTLRRKLFRLSAMFELADEQLSGLREQRHATEVEYATKVGRGSLDIPLDGSSLSAYWSLSPRFEEIRDLVGGRQRVVDEPTDYVDADRMQRDRRDLVSVAGRLGVETLGDLDNIIASYLRMPSAQAWDAIAGPRGGSSSEDLAVSSVEDLVTLLLMYHFEVDHDFFLTVYLEETWEEFSRWLPKPPDGVSGPPSA